MKEIYKEPEMELVLSLGDVIRTSDWDNWGDTDFDDEVGGNN